MTMDLVKLTLATVIAVLVAALLAMLVWPDAVFLIWAGLMVATFAGLWFQHRNYPEHSLLGAWRELFFGR
jgi:hypothetical protein